MLAHLALLFVPALALPDAMLGVPLLILLGLRDAAAKGFAVGVAAHGPRHLTGAFQNTEQAGAFSGLCMGLNGTVTALLAPDYRQLDRRRSEVAWRIVVNNAGDDGARVEVIERLPGDWELVEGGEAGWSRLSADTMARTVTLAPGAETTLLYRARISR